ncbi:MAG: hypothetical protein QOI80_19, partial [Solirubrobacteraceae bacterium]|nr:hypothetical protein [Solirubrobacteraceae bacterium]
MCPSSGTSANPAARVYAPYVRAAIAIVTLLALAPGAAAKVRIQVTSNRADLVSGGDARIVVTGARKARITLGKRDVTQAFERRGRRREGVVTGLKLGRNVVRVERTRLVITNHAQSGPILAGPQIQPWQCQDTRVDAQCNQPPKFNYLYKSTDDRQKDLQPYDPESPPDDVATVTTENGQTVPFVVRMETGYQDRDQYKIAVLFDPRQGWSGMHPQPTFNHKLLITHGASCDVDYAAGTAPSVTSYDPSGLPVGTPGGAKSDSAEYALGQGFVLMSTALDNTGHNCDVVTQAESLVMAKVHVIE